MALPVDTSSGLGGTRTTNVTEENYAFFQQHIYRESGIVLDLGKDYLLEARLTPILRRESLASLNDLCALLRATGGQSLKREVVEAMTTNETHFFRDLAQYEALKTTLFPQLLEQRRLARRLSFWSAAASTGQEAYSLAMLMRGMELAGWNIQILGTDLAESVLKRAREGKYMQIEVNRGLPAIYLTKYFTRHGMEWQLKDDIRAMVRFEGLDLRQDMHRLGPFDVVFCRNVLIYFDLETRKKILRQIDGTLFRGGYLFLGTAETALGLEDRFERRSVGQAIVYQAR
jgi:chemotaxis protein methyltransferase CheR